MGKPLYLTAVTMLLVALGGGCSMCQQCELDTYSAYGGRWQRTDRSHGRVGSVFAPAGGLVPYDASDDPHAAEQASEAPELRPPGRPEGERSPDDAAEAAPPEGDSVLQDEAEREAEQERQRRLRELQLEDIRYEK